MEKIEQWIHPPAMLVPPLPGELHLWLIDLDLLPVRVAHYLNPEERDQANRMRVESGVRRYINARGTLRKVLGDYLATDPQTLRFSYGVSGKPGLEHPPSPLHFNLTHSGRFALLAITGGRDIGIDIEPVKYRDNLLKIADKVFGEAVGKTLSELEKSEQTVCFLQAWTLLEARAKCRGGSVFGDTDNSIPAVNFEPMSGWIAAVALEQGVPETKKWCAYRLG